MVNTAPYLVCRMRGEPSFDSAPVAKVTDYPLEKRDYRPFAQGILCRNESRLFLRLWAFEVSPAAGSKLACVVYPYPDSPGRGLEFSFVHGADEHVAVNFFPVENGERREFEDKALLAEISADFTIRPHNGEDLQGVYWGVTVSVALSLLERLGGRTAFESGDSFPGNFYKLCTAEGSVHKGSHFPALFPEAPFIVESMGEFSVVDY